MKDRKSSNTYFLGDPNTPRELQALVADYIGIDKHVIACNPAQVKDDTLKAIATLFHKSALTSLSKITGNINNDYHSSLSASMPIFNREITRACQSDFDMKGNGHIRDVIAHWAAANPKSINPLLSAVFTEANAQVIKILLEQGAPLDIPKLKDKAKTTLNPESSWGAEDGWYEYHLDELGYLFEIIMRHPALIYTVIDIYPQHLGYLIDAINILIKCDTDDQVEGHSYSINYPFPFTNTPPRSNTINFITDAILEYFRIPRDKQIILSGSQKKYLNSLLLQKIDYIQNCKEVISYYDKYKNALYVQDQGSFFDRLLNQYPQIKIEFIRELQRRALHTFPYTTFRTKKEKEEAAYLAYTLINSDLFSETHEASGVRSFRGSLIELLEDLTEEATYRNPSLTTVFLTPPSATTCPLASIRKASDEKDSVVLLSIPAPSAPALSPIEGRTSHPEFNASNTNTILGSLKNKTEKNLGAPGGPVITETFISYDEITSKPTTIINEIDTQSASRTQNSLRFFISAAEKAKLKSIVLPEVSQYKNPK